MKRLKLNSPVDRWDEAIPLGNGLIGVLLWKPRLALRAWVAYPVLIILVLYWILRNIPVYPFLLLAPH